MVSSWPLEEDDEQCVTERDRRLEEPWNYFEDVDEFLIYEAETAEMRERKRRHDSRAGQGLTGQGGATALCAGVAGQEIPGQSDTAVKCARVAGQEISGQSDTAVKCARVAGQEISGQNDTAVKCARVAASHTDSRQSGPSPLCAFSAACATELPSKRSQPGETACSCGSRHDEEALSRAREICTMPHDADAAETFLMDILADDSGPRLNTTQRMKSMSIRFFLPEELYELWNLTAMNWLMQVTAEETMNSKTIQTKEITVEEVNESPMRYIGYVEGFLAALLQDWLLTERLHLKVSSNYAILKRDHFQCQVPGCKCRRNLEVHHIIWRSKGGSDYDFNLITLCRQHHRHILHNLMALKIEGTAPHNLTFTFGPHSSDSDGPFLIYHKGRKKVRNALNTIEHLDVSGEDPGDSLN